MSKIMRLISEALKARQQRKASRRLASPRPVSEREIASLAEPPGQPPVSLVFSSALLSRYHALWQRHRRPAAAFASACVAAALLGAFTHGPVYQASTMVAVNDKQIQNEWDLLKDESRDVDFEEQIRSRAVLEPALRQLGLFPPSPRRFLWFARPPLSGDAERQALVRAIQTFEKRLGVERLRHSEIIQITVKSTNPARAAAGANAVTQSWFALRRKHAVAQIEPFLAAVEEELRGLHDELEALDAMRSQFPMDDASLQELAKQLASVEAQFSQAVSRYAADSPIVLHIRREKAALEAILRERATGPRLALQEYLAGHPKPARSRGQTEEPTIGTLDALITHADRRYQELLQQQAQARLTLAVWNEPSDASGTLTIIDEALPPPAKPGWIRLLATLLAASALGLLGLVLVPVTLNLCEARTERASAALRQRLIDMMALPLPTNGSDDQEPSYYPDDSVRGSAHVS